MEVQSDFVVFASRDFLVFVLINLTVLVLDDSQGPRVEVIDNGPGIDKKVLPHIFDHFFTTKTRGSNTGVDLTFCRNVMETFGGTIKCRSVVSEFTKFTLGF